MFNDEYIEYKSKGYENTSTKKYLEKIPVIHFIVCQYAVDELCCDEDYVTDKDIISMYQFVDFFKGKARSVL